jgi:hypothetical protein
MGLKLLNSQSSSSRVIWAYHLRINLPRIPI